MHPREFEGRTAGRERKDGAPRMCGEMNGAVVSAWANTPFLFCFFPAIFLPRANREWQELQLCCCAGEVDPRGLCISSGESPPTNLPLGASGHWPLSLLPLRTPGSATAPRYQLHINYNEVVRRELDDVSVPKETRQSSKSIFFPLYELCSVMYSLLTKPLSASG